MDRKLYKVDMDVRRNGRVGLLDLENVVDTVVKSGQCTSNQVGLVPWSWREGVTVLGITACPDTGSRQSWLFPAYFELFWTI